jgi:hypothetical protein
MQWIELGKVMKVIDVYLEKQYVTIVVIELGKLIKVKNIHLEKQ